MYIISFNVFSINIVFNNSSSIQYNALSFDGKLCNVYTLMESKGFVSVLLLLL